MAIGERWNGLTTRGMPGMVGPNASWNGAAWSGALWVALACLAAGLLFREGIADLWKAWQTPEYSHGPLIPVISAYLFLRQLKHVPRNPGPVTDRWPGVVVVVLALMVGLLGNITQIQKIVSVAVILWVGGMVLISFGWARGRQFWPPVLHLVFMLPLPFFLYWKTSLALQLVSSELGVWLIRLVDIPVFLDGHVIDLGLYKLHVAEACSGLRYLFPILSFTYLFAVLYQGSFWHKAILLLAAAPIAILMNAVRIGIVGIIVDNYGIEHAEGFMHFFEGWVVFMLCILALIGLSRVLQRTAGDRRSLVQVLDLDVSGLGPQLARLGDVRPSAALLGSSLAIALAAIVWSPLTRPEAPAIERDPFILFPRALGEWRGLMNPELDAEIAEVLAADDTLSMTFEASGQAAPVDFFVAWYSDQTRADIHTPEICIPAAGWEMSGIGPHALTVETGAQTLSFDVNRAIIQKGLNRQLVYYWFDQNGRRLASDYAAKAWLVLDAIGNGRTDGALVRFITPIAQNESEGSADERLTNMVGAAMGALPRFIATDTGPVSGTTSANTSGTTSGTLSGTVPDRES
ncbi:MAG: VPLPA-CTERM-specific exosortase XrtD [Pseudomonadota bacterium]